MGRARFQIHGKPIAEMDVSQLAYWALSAVNPHTRLGCLATLLDKLNHGHVVRGLLLSLDTYDRESDTDDNDQPETDARGCTTGNAD